MVWLHEVLFSIVSSPESLTPLLLVSSYSVIVYVLVIVCGQIPVSALLFAVISIISQVVMFISPSAFPNASNSASVKDVWFGRFE